MDDLVNKPRTNVEDKRGRPTQPDGFPERLNKSSQLQSIILLLGVIGGVLSSLNPPAFIQNKNYTQDFQSYVDGLWRLSMVVVIWALVFVFIKKRLMVAAAGVVPLTLALIAYSSFTYQSNLLMADKLASRLCHHSASTDGSARCQTGAPEVLARSWSTYDPTKPHAWDDLRDPKPVGLDHIFADAGSFDNLPILTMGRVIRVNRSLSGGSVIMLDSLRKDEKVDPVELRASFPQSAQEKIFVYHDAVADPFAEFTIYCWVNPGEYNVTEGDVIGVKGVVVGTSRLVSTSTLGKITYNASIIGSSIRKIN